MLTFNKSVKNWLQQKIKFDQITLQHFRQPLIVDEILGKLPYSILYDNVTHKYSLLQKLLDVHDSTFCVFMRPGEQRVLVVYFSTSLAKLLITDRPENVLLHSLSREQLALVTDGTHTYTGCHCQCYERQ